MALAFYIHTSRTLPFPSGRLDLGSGWGKGRPPFSPAPSSYIAPVFTFASISLLTIVLFQSTHAPCSPIHPDSMSRSHVAYNHTPFPVFPSILLYFLVFFFFFLFFFVVVCLAAVCSSSRPDLFLSSAKEKGMETGEGVRPFAVCRRRESEVSSRRER